MDRVRQSMVIDEMVRERAGQLRVCMPARIEAYNATTALATVQPLLKVKPHGAASIMLPAIANVPVVHPRTATAMIRLPITVGDIVTLVFGDRSLEAWLQGNGDPKETGDTRMHHLSDAYAILGGYPKGKTWPATTPAALEIAVKPGTKIILGNGTDDLLKAAHDAFASLKALCNQMSAALTQMSILTVTGVEGGSGTSGPPVNTAAFVTLKSSVDSIAAEVQAEMDSLGNLKT